jgi:SAM-dependent methyltransferase
VPSPLPAAAAAAESPLPGDIREVGVLALAAEVVADPSLLRSWAAVFAAEDPVTLVIYAPGWSDDDVAAKLGTAVADAGLDHDDSPDLLAVPGTLSSLDAHKLAARCSAALSRTEPPEPFHSLRRVDEHGLPELRDLLPAAFLEMTSGSAERVSPELLAFADEAANERRTILEFMVQVSDELGRGERVLDVGAGEQPYRELFEHVDYVTADWANSVHPGARHVDIVAPADDLPVEDASFDAVINTQVLEHVAEPSAVLNELHRVLRPGGRLFMTLPFAWELHEEPFDFYRYTRYGISHLLRKAGFTAIDARPRNDCFSTIAQLMFNTWGAMGRADDGRNAEREQAGRMMREMAAVVQSFAPLDTRWSLPLGYAIRARRPEGDR